MREIENLKESILKEYPRLSKDSEFQFSCRKDAPCFNDCCGDVNIFLTPYDVLRLKQRLGISSGEFLAKYTISPFDENLKYPVVLLKMSDNEKKNCQFVSDDGCTVYEDRPWACRMYPLGMASPGKDSKELNEEFYFLLKESICKGFVYDQKWTIREWLKDQGIDDYNANGEDFKELTTHKFFSEGGNLPPQKIEMFFMVCYDLNKFRHFLFDSTFFDKFVVDDDTINKIKSDDLELLKFGYNWLKFILFGDKTMTINQEMLQAKKDEMRKRSESN